MKERMDAPGLTAMGGEMGGLASRTYDRRRNTTTTERQAHGKRHTTVSSNRMDSRNDQRIWSHHDSSGLSDPCNAARYAISSEPRVFVSSGPSSRTGTENTRAMRFSGKRTRSAFGLSKALTDTLSIRYPLRYRLRSCLSTIGGRCGQFWPNVLPVVWTQVFSAHNAASGALDSDAALNGNCTHARRPLPNKLRLRTNGSCQFGLAAVRRKISGELHCASISDTLNYTQALYEACRSFSKISGTLLICP